MNAVKTGELYQIAKDGSLAPNGIDKTTHRVRATGDFRPPKAGEWFLSGAIVEAYYASSNIDQSYHIGELVKGEVITYWREIPS